MRLHLLSGGLLMAWCVASAAERDGTQAGFALNRFTIAERGSDWFVLESLDFRGHMRAAMGLGLEWARRPLVLDDSGLVDQQLVSHIGLSVILRDRVRLAVNLPAVLQQSGKEGMAFIPPDSSSVGDLHLGADVRLLGGYRDRASLAAGLQIDLPTGDQNRFASDGKVRLALRLLAAGELDRYVWAAKAGFLYRGQDAPVGGAPYGSELFAAVAVGARLGQQLLVGAELYGGSVTSSFFEERATSLELLFGGHLRVARDWRAGLGLGPGLSSAPGTPSFRMVASVNWAPAPTVVQIAARPVAPPAAPPPPEPESAPVVLAPPPPVTPAPPAPPDGSRARVEKDQIVLREPLAWKRGSDKISPSSQATLRGVAELMEAHPEITHVNVVGKLPRARAVVRFLTQHGVAPQRLSAEEVASEDIELAIDELVKP